MGEEATATVSIAKAQSTEQRRKGAGSPSLSLRVTDFQLIFRFGLDFLQPPWSVSPSVSPISLSLHIGFNFFNFFSFLLSFWLVKVI